MKQKSLLLLLLTIIAMPYQGNHLYAQGCSDAGLCTMGAMRPDQAYQTDVPLKLRFAEIGYYQGQTPVSATINAIILDLGFDVFKEYNIHLKIPYMFVSGNFGNTQGLGDISISSSKHVKKIGDFDLNATVGFKIPTGNADLKHPDEDVVLPMYYQTTLATFDLVAGAALINENWLISTAFQQPLLHFNENNFTADPLLWEWYPGGQEYVQRHASANMLRRGTDVMLRIERNFRFSRLNFNVGLLPIYRITNDQVMDENGEYIKPEGASGLASSLLMGAGYRFNVKSRIKLIYGLRITDRKKNPDGLTRTSVLNISYNYAF